MKLTDAIFRHDEKFLVLSTDEYADPQTLSASVRRETPDGVEEFRATLSIKATPADVIGLVDDIDYALGLSADHDLRTLEDAIRVYFTDSF